MKKTLLIGFLVLCNSVFGQIPGKTIEESIVIFDTLTIKQGDIIYLGKGSDPETADFKYLYSPKNTTIPLAKDIISGFFSNTDFSSKAIPQQNLNKGFAGKQLVIGNFSKVSSKKKGKKILGVINKKEYQFIEGIYFNDIVVDFEPAIRSGEIIKISAPELTEKAPAVELLFSPFEMTVKGIEPVIVAFNNLNRNELYNKAIDWTNSYYIPPNQATITTFSEEKVNIYDFAKNVKFSTIMGADIFADLPYLFSVDFTDNEIRMTFTLGGENGDITAENGEVIANISPSSIFDKNGEVRKMSRIFKVEAERIMNDLSYAMVDYLMK